MFRKVVFLLLQLIFLISCQKEVSTEQPIKDLATTFFEHYAERSDWQGFLDLYSDSVYFQDVIFRMELNGKTAFKTFYNWPDSNFMKHPEYPETLVLEDLAVNDSSAVGRGYFTPFYYGGMLYDDAKNMRFTMWLYFDQQGKIIRHIDFIEYPPSFLKSAAERLINEKSENETI